MSRILEIQCPTLRVFQPPPPRLLWPLGPGPVAAIADEHLSVRRSWPGPQIPGLAVPDAEPRRLVALARVKPFNIWNIRLYDII